MHIRAFEGRDSKTNKLILKALAFNSHSIKWEIFKEIGEVSWATISRRVDDLEKRGYIRKTGKRRVRIANRKEDTFEYGLTWKGFVAPLTISKVQNITEVLENNPQLKLPLPVDFKLIRKVLGDEQIEKILKIAFETAIKPMNYDLESIEEKMIPECFSTYIIGGLREKIEKEGASILLKHPQILDWYQKRIDENIKSIREALRDLKRELEKHEKIKEKIRLLKKSIYPK